MKSSLQNKKAAPPRFLKAFVIVFVSVLLVLSAILGGFAVYRESRTLMRYGGTYCDEPTYRYLASYYKSNYLRALAGIADAEDTEAFWSSTDSKTGKTHATLLEEGTKDYISRILICSALFDGAASASQKREAKAAAKSAAEDILTYRANGDIEALNALTEPYGYAYEDLEGIALLLYKSAKAQTLFYGADGETVSTRLTECNEYLKENYYAVSLFFIRTATTYSFTTDEEGNKTADLDENGNYVFRDLLTAEKEARAEMMALLDAEIASGNPRQAFFESLMAEHYANYPEGQSLRHYFADGSAYTQSFIEAGGEEILTAAKSLAVGKCAKVAYEDGYCYIFKYEAETGAFAEESYKNYFTDFYASVASHLFSEDISLFLEDVVTRKERTDAVSLTKIPYKNLIRVRF